MAKRHKDILQELREQIEELQIVYRYHQRREAERGAQSNGHARVITAAQVAHAMLDANAPQKKKPGPKPGRKKKKRTPMPSATDGPSLLTALRQVLSTKAQSLDQLEAAIVQAGYQHRGTTPFRTRIAQEARHLIQQGTARRTKEGWRRKGPAPVSPEETT